MCIYEYYYVLIHTLNSKKMARQKSGKERCNFLIDSEIYKDFSLLCEELGLVRSKKLENYMKNFIEEKEKASKKGGKAKVEKKQ